MPRIERYIRIIGIPILALLLTIFTKHAGSENYTFTEEFLMTLFFTFIYWNGAYFIFMFYRARMPDIRHTFRKLTLTISSIVIFILIASPVGKFVLGIITWDELKDPSVMFEFVPLTILLSIMIGSIYEGAFLFDKWRITVQQNEALKNQQIRMQFEVLQNQMSPHFLFNSLNTLTTLIAEDQNRAIEFTEALSEVYRYILQQKDRELIPLTEEVAFSRSYVFLLQMRYPDNLQVHFDIPENYFGYSVAPLTLQMLIENAMKHNVISSARPLKVEIYIDKKACIVVKNNYQPKKTHDKSTQTGLANIRKRYEFLGKENIEVINTAENYMVTVPLVKVHKEENEIIPSWA